MELKYRYLIAYLMIVLLLLIIWVLPKLSDCNIVKYIHKNEKRLHSILFIILAFIIISNGYIYPTQDIKNSLIHENIYVYYAVLIFIILCILHELYYMYHKI